jgi:hypothetical protein
MPTLKGCKQLVKELFLKHFLLPPHLHHDFGAAARDRHYREQNPSVKRLFQEFFRFVKRPFPSVSYQRK